MYPWTLVYCEYLISVKEDTFEWLEPKEFFIFSSVAEFNNCKAKVLVSNLDPESQEVNAIAVGPYESIMSMEDQLRRFGINVERLNCMPRDIFCA